MKKEKSNWHITRRKANDHINNVVERIRTERLPVCIDEIIVFGSFINGKLNPHDVDFLLVIRKDEPEDYNEAWILFRGLSDYYIKSFSISLYEWFQRYGSPQRMAIRMIRRGMKGVHLNLSYESSGDALLGFIRVLKDKEKPLKSGFLMKVVWSRSWEKELPRDKEHPLLPYLRFMQMTNNAGIYRSMKKIDERIKTLSAYNGGDWKALLNKKEKQCYDDATRERNR